MLLLLLLFLRVEVLLFGVEVLLFGVEWNWHCVEWLMLEGRVAQTRIGFKKGSILCGEAYKSARGRCIDVCAYV